MRLPVILLACAAFGMAADPSTLTVRGHVFKAEIARTDEAKTRGLMFRASLPADACMVFLYDDDGQRAIWMRNCKIALDVLWVDAQGRIVELVEKAPPCPPETKDEECPNYGGAVASRHFIELAPGTIAKLGLKVGDAVAWDLQVPKEGRWLYSPGVMDRATILKD
jgi:hypothetical protein